MGGLIRVVFHLGLFLIRVVFIMGGLVRMVFHYVWSLIRVVNSEICFVVVFQEILIHYLLAVCSLELGVLRKSVRAPVPACVVRTITE